jgi:hypothetical protein
LESSFSLMSIEILPFSFLIPLIWVFIFLLLVILARGLSILFIFQRTGFLFHWFIVLLCGLQFIDFFPDFNDLFPSITF